MQSVIQRIDTWVSTQAPHIYAMLPQGASVEAIQRAQDVLGVTFPEDLQTLYHLHNGFANVWLFGWNVLSLEAMVKHWTWQKDEAYDWSADPSRDWRLGFRGSEGRGSFDGRLDTKLLPCLRDDIDGVLSIDTAQTRYGTYGCVIEERAERGYFTLYAPSVHVLFSAFAQALETNDICITSPTDGPGYGVGFEDGSREKIRAFIPLTADLFSAADESELVAAEHKHWALVRRTELLERLEHLDGEPFTLEEAALCLEIDVETLRLWVRGGVLLVTPWPPTEDEQDWRLERAVLKDLLKQR